MRSLKLVNKFLLVLYSCLQLAAFEVIQRKLEMVPSLSGKITPSVIYATLPDLGRIECSSLCNSDEKCLAIFYVDGTCHLTNQTAKNAAHVATPSAVYFRKACPDSFLYVSSFDGCFMFVMEALSWQAARINCNAMGGHLDAMYTGAELNFIFNHLRQRYLQGGAPSYWIGGNDLETENTWKWTTGRLMLDDGWYFYPGTDTAKNCMAIYLTGVVNTCWSHENCADTRPSVCEINLP